MNSFSPQLLQWIGAGMLMMMLFFVFVPALAHGAILPPCDPTKFPKEDPNNTGDNGPCGLWKFGILIQNIIKFLLIIVVPIAFLIIGWAGFKILTSAGNAEKVGHAKEMIKIAVGGVLILLLSLLIIYAVFNALGVQQTTTEGGNTFTIPGSEPSTTPPPSGGGGGGRNIDPNLPPS